MRWQEAGVNLASLPKAPSRGRMRISLAGNSCRRHLSGNTDTAGASAARF